MTSSDTEIPEAAGRLPIVGHALSLRRDAIAFLQSLPQYGDMIEVHLGPRRAIVVTTPDLVRQVLVGDAKAFHKGAIFDKARPFLGNGVLLSSGPFHLKQRRLVQPAFHRQRVAQYVRTMNDETVAAAGTLVAGRTVDMRRVLYDLVITILGTTLFSTELGGWVTREAQRSMPIIQNTVLRRTISPLPFLERLPTLANRRFDRAVAGMDTVLSHVIAQYQRDEETDRGDLLSMLVAATHADTGLPMPAHQLKDELLNIFAAGMETTTDTLAWACYEIGRQPGIQQRAFEEADRVLAGRPATIEKLAELTYIQQVIKEVLRLHPPTNLLMRRSVAPVTLGGVPIPVGTEVIVSPLLLHHNPRLFPKPTQFDPDRWSRPEQALPRGAYFPFGLGSRQCLGDTFALTEMPIVLATLLTHWRLHPAPGHIVRPVQAVTVSPGRLLMIPEARTRRTPAA
ncbi:cytochrome P450 [Kitasatospora sp. NPDC088346]|uniref:cytochrome P450 n=1 Tax=Kitasatospora sp. NPDC088346 TaxID=3364073 RepID=UPI00380BABFD